VANKRAKSNQVCDLPQAELFDRFDKLVDIIIDDGSEPQYGVSTIVDLMGDRPEVIRQGLGSLEFMSLSI
jgi:tRNA A37 threonylcarbamoyladenosine synthetase subunit TsaC/SUA5/YrdC